MLCWSIPCQHCIKADVDSYTDTDATADHATYTTTTTSASISKYTSKYLDGHWD